MDREIDNVFRDMPGNNCFACHPENPVGLKLRFFADDARGDVYTRIKPEDHFSGFPGILHGGIQCALVDEVAFWAMFDKLGKIGLTTKVEMQYLKAVSSSFPLEVRGRVSRVRDRMVVVDTSIFYENNTELTKSRITYFLPNRKVLFDVMGEETFTPDLMKHIKE